MIVPETEAQRELEPDENLLWAGRPDPSKQGAAYIGIVLFGIPWTAFSLFMMWQMITQLQNHGTANGMSIIPVLFLVPFVLIGVGLMSAPYWAARKAKSTVYAVTSRRIMVIQAGNNRSVRSVHSADLGELDRTERPDGSGNLIFGKPQYQGNSNTTSVSYNDRFIGIPNVRMVEQLIRDNLKNASAGQFPGQNSVQIDINRRY